MADQTTNALALYPGWDHYQHLLTRMISPLSPDQLALRSAPSLRTVGENCLHIIGARARWCHLIMGIGDETFAAYARWDAPDAPRRGATELADGLRQSWLIQRDGLARWTAGDLAFTYPNTEPDPGEPEVFTRAWILWHLIEHDVHHGGEISQILGMHGITGLNL